MKFKQILSITILATIVAISSVFANESNLLETNSSLVFVEENPIVETTHTTIVNSSIVTTGQFSSFDKDGNIINPSPGETFYGQDSNYLSNDFSFTINDDGTTYDANTGLTWITIPVGGKMNWEDAVEYCENLSFAGYDDWRIPTVEELFSISDFSEGWPYLDTEYFQFDTSENSLQGNMSGSPQGNRPRSDSSEEELSKSGMSMMGEMPDGQMPMMGGMPEGQMPMMGGMPEGQMPMMGEMPEGQMPMMGEMTDGQMPMMGEMTDGQMPMIGEMPEAENSNPTDRNSMSSPASKDDGQFWTASINKVEGDSRLGNIAFGVNHSTGHIKAYPANSSPSMGKYVRAVRGDVYGSSEYTNNNDGTITDNSSGLMWLQADLGIAADWEYALYLAETSEFAGYDDWRLPDVKELQSIVDYEGAYPAINQDYFTFTELDANPNYYYWTSTSAYFNKSNPDYDSAWYVAFGYTSHGAGAVRFSPKYEGSNASSEGEDNILNSVRLVRTIEK